MRGCLSNNRHRTLTPHCPASIITYVIADLEAAMAEVVTINRPDVVALIEAAAKRFTGGDKTEAVALALRRLLDENTRSGSLFGRQKGSVIDKDGVDLIAPVLQDPMEAEAEPML